MNLKSKLEGLGGDKVVPLIFQKFNFSLYFCPVQFELVLYRLMKAGVFSPYFCPVQFELVLYRLMKAGVFSLYLICPVQFELVLYRLMKAGV